MHTPKPTSPDIAIVYWCYKESAVARNHLEVLRRHNPNRKVYGVFGGEPRQAHHFRKTLAGLLDDFWTYPGTYGDSEYEKWIHGDLMLLDWYDKRGRDLTWESIAITQWDMLVFTDIANLTPGIRKEQLYFSGHRKLDKALERRFRWTRPGGPERTTFETFRDYIANKYGYQQELRCCLYIYEVLTRQFFDKYLKFPVKKAGMLEYKNPTLAAIHGLDVYERDLGVYWKEPEQDITQLPLNAMPQQLAEHYIQGQLTDPAGWRLFHPYAALWQ